jgi:hypothetical protein
MKTESLQNQKSSPASICTDDAEIFTTHRLLQDHKTLTKTESLQTHKSSPETSSAGAAEIFSPHKLLQNQK